MQRRKLWTVGLSLVLSLFAVGGWQGGALPTKALYAASSTPTATAIPSTRAVISPDNVDQVHLRGSLGKGPVGNFVWAGNGQRMAVSSPTGIWWYDLSNPNASPQNLDENGRGLASSNDGRIMAWSNRLNVVVWNTETGKVQAEIRLAITNEQNFWNDVAVSQDGSTVVATDLFLTLYVYESRTGEQFAVTNRAPSSMAVTSTREALAPDGSMLAVADDLKGLIVLQLGTSDFTPLDTGLPTKHAMSVSFSNDGRLLAAGYSDGEIWIEDVTTRQVIQRLTGQTSPLYILSFVPDKSQLVAVHQNGMAEFWNLASAKVQFAINNAEHQWDEIAFSFDSKLMVAIVRYEAVQVWDTTTDRLRFTLSDASNATFSPDGKTLAAEFRGTVGVWDIESGKLLNTLPDHSPIGSTIFPGADSQRIMSLDDYGELRFYDSEAQHEIGHRQLPVSGGRQVLFEPDQKTLIVGRNDGLIRIVDIDSQQVKQTLTTRTQLNQIALSRDGKILAAACEGGLFVWDVPTGERLWVASDNYLTVSFSGDGQLLAALTSAGKGQLWDVATHTLKSVIKVFVPYSDEFYVAPGAYILTFAPDGKTLAYSVGRSTIKLRNIDTSLDYQDNIECYEGDIITMAFNPVNSLIAVSCVWVYEKSFLQFEQSTATGAKMVGDFWTTMIDIHEFAYGSELTFSPDGKLLLIDSFWLFGI